VNGQFASARHTAHCHQSGAVDRNHGGGFFSRDSDRRRSNRRNCALRLTTRCQCYMKEIERLDPRQFKSRIRPNQRAESVCPSRRSRQRRGRDDSDQIYWNARVALSAKLVRTERAGSIGVLQCLWSLWDLVDDPHYLGAPVPLRSQRRRRALEDWLSSMSVRCRSIRVEERLKVPL